MKFSSASVRLPNATGASPAPQLSMLCTADEWEILKDAPCLHGSTSVLNVVVVPSGQTVAVIIEPALAFHNTVHPTVQKRRLNDCIRELRILGFSKGLKDESTTALMTYSAGPDWSPASEEQVMSRQSRDDDGDFEYTKGPRNTRIRKERR